MLRAAVCSVIVMAALAGIGMVAESIGFITESSDQGIRSRFFRLVLLGFANLAFLCLLAVGAGLYFWARVARSLPELQGWHLQKPDSEFGAGDLFDQYSFGDYLAQEERVFAELETLSRSEWAEEFTGAYNRFDPSSVCHPLETATRNWNRSHRLEAKNPIGGVLLLHGLSDSPYSLRALGERLHSEGYTVVWLRVPGHGTCPRALADVSWQDWAAAVEVAVKGLRELVPQELPLVLAGYSNGGALSLNYVLSAIEDSSLPGIDSVLLFSPMIGVNPLARMTHLYHAVGLFSRNEKTKWSSIFAEIDPYKYSSWPMNANVQAWRLTKVVERKLGVLEKAQKLDQLPPVLAMQSVVDATVVVPKLITLLFDRLSSESSELVLFDVNRMERLSNLLNLSFESTVRPRLAREDRPYKLSVLRNQSGDSNQVALFVRQQGRWSERPVDGVWPLGVVSLSHVAVPFSPEDPVYGQSNAGYRYSLGTISMRAEPQALMIPSSLFARCRHNPFYGFMESHVIEWLQAQTND